MNMKIPINLFDRKALTRDGFTRTGIAAAEEVAVTLGADIGADIESPVIEQDTLPEPTIIFENDDVIIYDMHDGTTQTIVKNHA